MRNSVRKLTVLFGTTAAAFAMGMGPASADTTDSSASGAAAGDTCEGELSPATQEAWENWDEGAGLFGEGAARMVSGAWVGVPNSIVDLLQEEGLSEETIHAWDNWNRGGGQVSGGAGQMVSGAWVGVPHSIVDLLERASCAADGGADLPEDPMELPTQE